MGISTVHLPDGQTITVKPVFAGIFFQFDDLNTHHSLFPAGWMTVLHTEDSSAVSPLTSEANIQTRVQTRVEPSAHSHSPSPLSPPSPPSSSHLFRRPTLQNDSLFISSISNPSSSEFKPAASPTRQIAMMLWVSLYWYFHQPTPDPVLPTTATSQSTPAVGRPRGEWLIHIKRDGVLRGRNLIPKLERMGLIATLDTAVGGDAGGCDSDDADSSGTGGCWDHMYVSQGMFWQISAQLFLFTLQPIEGHKGVGGASSFPGSPMGSRPASPSLEDAGASRVSLLSLEEQLQEGEAREAREGREDGQSLGPPFRYPSGPFFSTSHLPTYFPPGPLRYTTSGGVRHPARPKPPRMGEVFYTRFVSSVGQYLSLRVASSSPRPVPYLGPVGPQPPAAAVTPDQGGRALTALSDTALLQHWMAKPRVSAFWGGFAPDFLSNALASRHSFPVIALWDGVPFGYLEIYWVKEDKLGRHLNGPVAADDFDRGLHVFVGEEWARGRVQPWLSSAVHWILAADYRTMSVCIEPRVDNARFIQHLQLAGFNKECEVAFPHKQSWFGRLRRDGWTGPAL